jgi:hypothetical protein
VAATLRTEARRYRASASNAKRGRDYIMAGLDHQAAGLLAFWAQQFAAPARRRKERSR